MSGESKQTKGQKMKIEPKVKQKSKEKKISHRNEEMASHNKRQL